MNESDSVGRSINFEVFVQTRDSGRATLLNCSSYVMICNYLPFDVSFKCQTGAIKATKYATSEIYRDPRHTSVSETGLIISGLYRKLLGLDNNQPTTISFAVPDCSSNDSAAFEKCQPILIKDPAKPMASWDGKEQVRLFSQASECK